jgi:hypothetical protein
VVATAENPWKRFLENISLWWPDSGGRNPNLSVNTCPQCAALLKMEDCHSWLSKCSTSRNSESSLTLESIQIHSTEHTRETQGFTENLKTSLTRILQKSTPQIKKNYQNRECDRGNSTVGSIIFCKIMLVHNWLQIKKHRIARIAGYAMNSNRRETTRIKPSHDM